MWSKKAIALLPLARLFIISFLLFVVSFVVDCGFLILEGKFN